MTSRERHTREGFVIAAGFFPAAAIDHPHLADNL
jgi:hypothetical protein